MRDLTEAERTVLDLLREATTEFAGLPQAHVADLPDFMDAIHRLQNIVLARPATESLQSEKEKAEGENV